MSVLDSVLSKVGLQRAPKSDADLLREALEARQRLIERKIIPAPKKQQLVRYAAGASHRLFADWSGDILTADGAIRAGGLATLRGRSRQLERDNNYWRRWLSALENNVLGAEGVNLQMKIRFKSGRYDSSANDTIEAAWREWSRPENCSLSQSIDWVEMQKLVLRSTARDGGIMVRKYRDPKVNPFGFTLQPIEIDMLDENYNETLTTGNIVRMGVEQNAKNQVVAYWILDVHPGEYQFPIRARRDHIRVAAEEILHYYVKERVTQSIGIPWGCSAMRTLHHIEEYIQAELTASREAACKGGYFQSEKGDVFAGDSENVEDADGNVTQNTLNDFEPASFDQLPAGMTFIPYDIQHPTDAFGEFVRRSVLEATAGMDSDYATITGDLKDVNYSSMRSGKLEVWESYKKMQGHFVTYFCIPIFEKWLEMAMLVGKVNLPMSRFGAFNKPRFRGRRWPWVDPSVDVKAMLDAVDGGLKTRTEVIAENGGDFEDVVEELAYEQQLAKEKNLVFATPARPDKPAPASTSTASSPPAEEEEEEPDEEVEENA